MKICWDNLEKLRYNLSKDIWYKNHNPYIYKDSCKVCKDPYLTNLRKIGNFCSNKCSYEYKFKDNPPMKNKTHSERTKKAMSEKKKEKIILLVNMECIDLQHIIHGTI